MPRTMTRARAMLTVEVTIPVAAAPVTIWSLVSAAMTAAGLSKKHMLGFTIKGIDSAGTNRDAIFLGDAASNMKSRYAAGADASPAVIDLESIFVSNVAAATDTATIEVLVQ